MNLPGRVPFFMKDDTVDSSVKIGFVYYSFFPVTGGASVHGYNLAKELTGLGYRLYKINGEPDPYTLKKKYRVTGLLWILMKCDLMYIRMDYFFYFRNFITVLSLLAGKKTIVELNSPSDEMHLFGKSENYIKWADRVMRYILKKTDAVVVVSEALKNYCEQALDLKNVFLIENGGEKFPDAEDAAGPGIREKVHRMQKEAGRIVVWAGSLNKMQDLQPLKKLANELGSEIALALIVKEEDNQQSLSFEADNICIFKNPGRGDVKYIISQADIGLAFYQEYPWSRWGFYNSSLKIFEYLNNGLYTFTNVQGTKIQQSYPNFIRVSGFEDVVEWIRSGQPRPVAVTALRTWKDAGRETSSLIKEILKR